MNYRFYPVAAMVISCLCVSSLFADEGEKPLQLDLSAMPGEYKLALEKAAPGVKWSEATKTKRTYRTQDGKEETEGVIYVTGADKGNRKVTATFLKVAVVDEISCVYELKDLPAAIKREFINHASHGKPIQITSEGATLEKPSQYVFLYDNAAVMTISADGKDVRVFGF